MPKFIGSLTRMYSTEIEVEARDEEEAEALIHKQLDTGDTSHLEWERISKSEVIEEVYPA